MKKIFQKMIARPWAGALFFLGFWLSPLSPWNDLFTNIPLAYVFALAVSWAYEPLFAPSFVVGYWLTNALGFVLMHYGYSELRMRGKKRYSMRENWKTYAVVTTVATIVVAALGSLDILPTGPDIMRMIGK